MLLCLPAMAQNKNLVSGTVLDGEGKPLEGATVVVLQSKDWTVTDGSGSFSIMATDTDDIEVSYMGFETQTLNVAKRAKISVLMKEDNKLNELVFIGYGAVEKKDLTGSVSVVDMSDIRNVPVNSVDKALQGRVAGADFMTTTGEPGSTTSIRIRGTRSITASNEPLIVVDGVMDAINDLGDLNSDDIASITILKDASSTAIYGSRGANGVILITTKQDQSGTGKVNISLKSTVGFNQLPSSLDIMDGTEFALYRNDVAAFGNDSNVTDVDWTTPISGSVYSDPYSVGKGTDWIKAITRTSMYQNYSLTLSRSSGGSSFWASVSYTDNEGIIKASGEQKVNANLSLSTKLFKWLTLGYKGSYVWKKTDRNKASIGGTAYYSAAMYLSPLMSEDGYNDLTYYYINPPTTLIEQCTYYAVQTSMYHAVPAELRITDNLKINSTVAYYLLQGNTFQYNPSTLPMKTEGEGGYAYRSSWDSNPISWETTLTWKWKKRGHAGDLMGGVSLYGKTTHTFYLSGSGYMDDEVLWNNMGAVLDKDTYSAGTAYTNLRKKSFYARANYNFREKYYLTATARFDGASNFAADHKWGFFPSAAFKWNMSNEAFLKNWYNVDDLSLRLSVGLTGNDAISSYQSISTFSSTSSGYLFDESQPVAYYLSRLDSPDLTWEKTTLYNVALDISLFKQRLSITAEAYYSRTTDLLLSLAVPYQTGYTSRLTNIGETTNMGLELTVHSNNIVHRNFSWSTDFTISHNKQEVVDIGSEDFVSAYDSPGSNSYMMYGYVKGYPLNSLWGFKYAGVWHSQEEIDKNETTKTYVSLYSSLGVAKYYDINHDGVLNEEDLVYQGNADPYLYGGLQNTFNLFGFRLGVYFAYSLGGKIYNYSEFYMAGSTKTNQYRYMIDGWHPTRNPDSNIPRAGSGDNALPSDFMIHDASYLRLKTVSLSYTFNMYKKWCKNIVLTASGENLWLWKDYNGFDPDVSTSSSSSTLRRLDIGAYPKARTVTFTVQFNY